MRTACSHFSDQTQSVIEHILFFSSLGKNKIHRQDTVDRYKPSVVYIIPYAMHLNERLLLLRLRLPSLFYFFFCIHYYFQPAGWTHSEMWNTKPYLYGSQVTVRLSICVCVCVWEVWFFKEQAGYTIYLCIILNQLLFFCLWHVDRLKRTIFHFEAAKFIGLLIKIGFGWVK